MRVLFVARSGDRRGDNARSGAGACASSSVILRMFEIEAGKASRFILRTDHFIAVSALGAAALRDEYGVAEWQHQHRAA